MSPEAQPRFMHVANGTCTTRTIEAAGLGGICSIWADPLYEGPVPAVDDEELIQIRTRFLAAPPDADGPAWAAGADPSRDPVNDLREWRAAIERHESYDELILWFEHDLFDQLNLIQLLTWIHDRLSPAKPVSLVCIGAFPGRPDFKGLGELAPGELASLLETRQPVGEAQYEMARRAWRAFREPAPDALNDLRHMDTSALPFLAAAVTRFLQEYPWTIDGLSQTERRLLELADGDRIPLRQAFARIVESERVYYVTDSSLTHMALEFSRMTPPLLTLNLSGSTEPDVLRGTVEATDTGRLVVAGRLDRVAICGIDRWLGGVHLTGRRAIWRWDDARQRVVRT